MFEAASPSMRRDPLDNLSSFQRALTQHPRTWSFGDCRCHFYFNGVPQGDAGFLPCHHHALGSIRLTGVEQLGSAVRKIKRPLSSTWFQRNVRLLAAEKHSSCPTHAVFSSTCDLLGGNTLNLITQFYLDSSNVLDCRGERLQASDTHWTQEHNNTQSPHLSIKPQIIQLITEPHLEACAFLSHGLIAVLFPLRCFTVVTACCSFPFPPALIAGLIVHMSKALSAVDPLS